MKIILSRKGFDSSFGGVASPIVRERNGRDTLYSIPIPLDRATCGYEHIHWNGENLYSVIAGLRARKKAIKAGKTSPDKELGIPNTPHLDPDLVADARERVTGWRPMFGQSGAQETQLSNEGVNTSECPPLGERPLFLFFGWYRQAAKNDLGWRFLRGAPNLHAIFGWLQVDKKASFGGRSDRERFARENEWAKQHPHVACNYYDRVPNAVYIAPAPSDRVRNRLVIGNHDTNLPAAGMFRIFVPEVHTLTCDGRCPVDHQERDRRTHWKLPSWFYNNGVPILCPFGKPA